MISRPVWLFDAPIRFLNNVVPGTKYVYNSIVWETILLRGGRDLKSPAGLIKSCFYVYLPQP